MDKLLTRKGIDPTCMVEISKKYPRGWMLPEADPRNVKQLHAFGELVQ